MRLACQQAVNISVSLVMKVGFGRLKGTPNLPSLESGNSRGGKESSCIRGLDYQRDGVGLFLAYA